MSIHRMASEDVKKIHKLKSIAISVGRGIYERHLVTVVWVLYLTGSLAGPCMLPWFARTGGADEKALQIGVSRPQIGLAKTADVMRLFDVEGLRLAQQDTVSVLDEAKVMGEMCQGEWKHEGHRRHGLTWYEYSGVPPHAYDVVEASRVDGTESIMVVFPVRYQRHGARKDASLAMSIGHGLGWYLEEQEWLAKNVILLYMDVSNVTIHEGLKAWMEHVLDGHIDRRMGQVQQAVIFDVSVVDKETTRRKKQNKVHIKVHGWNGQLPNLDMYILARKNVELHGPRDTTLFVHDTSISSSMMDKTISFGTFVFHHAMGLADGGHAEILERGIDALTLKLDVSSDSTSVKGALQITEGVVRTLNNLQEKLHHATGLYALSGPYGLVDIGMYMGCSAVVLLAHVLKTIHAGKKVYIEGVGSWDKATGNAVFTLACIAYVFVHIQTVSIARLVDRRMTQSTAISCAHAMIQISILSIIAWKFCGALLTACWEKKQNKAVTNDVATKAIRAALVTSIALCLVLYRWSLAWLSLTMMIPLLP